MDTTHYRVLIYHVQTLDSLHFAANNNRKEDKEGGTEGGADKGHSLKVQVLGEVEF